MLYFVPVVLYWFFFSFSMCNAVYFAYFQLGVPKWGAMSKIRIASNCRSRSKVIQSGVVELQFHLAPARMTNCLGYLELLCNKDRHSLLVVPFQVALPSGRVAKLRYGIAGP